ncbi:helix-turn-helix transcriptional regulator [Nocardia sp. NPDC004604]|uniref:helix-turn-helix domain-containing protein n=1 Tax=Nocardia sp. NPDC004604 TaxID=3157013 RepID=UPI0033AB02F1
MATGSTLARRALGRELNRLREAAKMSQSAAGRVIGVSPQTIGRMEDGQPTKVSDLYVNALCDAYQATDGERVVLLGLAQEVRAAQRSGGGWWRAYADEIPADFDHYLALEEAAKRLTAWKLTVVPGMLQTPEYRRAMIWTETPNKDTEAVEKRIEIATRRQARLEERDFAVDVILSEAVVRDQIGGRSVMANQLRHLAQAGDRPNVSIRVVPFSAPSHLGSFVGSFVLLEFPALPSSKLTEPPVVYVEEYAGDLYLERDSEVGRYRDAVAEISRVALDEQATRRLLLELVEEYTG